MAANWGRRGIYIPKYDNPSPRSTWHGMGSSLIIDRRAGGCKFSTPLHPPSLSRRWTDNPRSLRRSVHPCGPRWRLFLAQDLYQYMTETRHGRTEPRRGERDRIDRLYITGLVRRGRCRGGWEGGIPLIPSFSFPPLAIYRAVAGNEMIAVRRIMSGAAAARFPQHYHFAVVTHLLRRGERERGSSRIFLHTNSAAHSLISRTLGARGAVGGHEQQRLGWLFVHLLSFFSAFPLSSSGS